MKTPAHITDPDQYLASLTEPRQTMLRALHQAIRAAAPELRPHVRNGMLGYGEYRYRYASGREGDWFVVGLASQKQYVSLYLCACDGDGYLAEKNARRLGRVSVGRSCIRFKALEDLNLPVALELVRQAATLTRQPGGFAM